MMPRGHEKRRAKSSRKAARERGGRTVRHPSEVHRGGWLAREAKWKHDAQEIDRSTGNAG
jgi:hypothetical protein